MRWNRQACRQGYVERYFVPLRELERYLLFMSLGTLGCLIVANGFVNDERLTVSLAFGVYWSVIFGVLWFAIRRGGWFHPVVFAVVWWEVFRSTIPKIGVYLGGLEQHSAVQHLSAVSRDGVLVSSLLLSAVGLLALCIGYLSSSRIPVPTVVFSGPRRLSMKMAVITVISVISFVVLVRHAGGLDQLLLQRGIIRTERVGEQIGSHWTVAVGVLKTACMVWLALRPEVVRRPYFVLLVVLSLGMGFATTGSRGGIIVTMLMLLMVWSLHRRRLPRMKFISIGILGLVLVGVLGEFRAQSARVQRVEDISLHLSGIDNVHKGFDTFISYGTVVDGTYAVLGNVKTTDDLLLGKSYMSMLFAPIPSAILPFDKPPAGGAMTATYLFNNPFNTIPPGVVGEAFWNFHVVGVVVVMFLFGIVLRWFGKLYVSHAGAPWVVVLYVVTLMRLQPTSDAFYSWFHAAVPAFVVLVFLCGVPRIGILARRAQRPSQ